MRLDSLARVSNMPHGTLGMTASLSPCKAWYADTDVCCDACYDLLALAHCTSAKSQYVEACMLKQMAGAGSAEWA